MKVLLIIFLCIFSWSGYSKSLIVEKALQVSYLIDTQVSGGTAVAIAYQGDSTLLITNDHICQKTRGILKQTQQPDYSKPLNTLPTSITDYKDNVYSVVVVKTSNVYLATKRSSDLCLVKVDKKLPIIELGERATIGDKVLSIGSPFYLFPYIREAYISAEYYLSHLHKRSHIICTGIWPGDSGGGVFNFETGKLVGITFAFWPTSSSFQYPDIYGGYVIPIDQVKQFLESYKKESK